MCFVLLFFYFFRFFTCIFCCCCIFNVAKVVIVVVFVVGEKNAIYFVVIFFSTLLEIYNNKKKILFLVLKLTTHTYKQFKTHSYTYINISDTIKEKKQHRVTLLLTWGLSHNEATKHEWEIFRKREARS